MRWSWAATRFDIALVLSVDAERELQKAHAIWHAKCGDDYPPKDLDVNDPKSMERFMRQVYVDRRFLGSATDKPAVERKKSLKKVCCFSHALDTNAGSLPRRRRVSKPRLHLK